MDNMSEQIGITLDLLEDLDAYVHYNFNYFVTGNNNASSMAICLLVLKSTDVGVTIYKHQEVTLCSHSVYYT